MSSIIPSPNPNLNPNPNPKFVFTMKPKPKFVFKPKIIQESSEINQYHQYLPNDILSYIATFINKNDIFSMLSYVLAIPSSMYEIKKKINIYINIYNEYSNIDLSRCLYKFMNEPIRVLINTFSQLFTVNNLLNYCTDSKIGAMGLTDILKRTNGKKIVIHLIKEQNKSSSREIYSIINDKQKMNNKLLRNIIGHNADDDDYLHDENDEFNNDDDIYNTNIIKTLHPSFYVIDVLTNSQLALIYKYIDIYEINNFVNKKLSKKYKKNNSNIKCLSIFERSLLMQYIDTDDNFSKFFEYKHIHINLLIIEALKINSFKILEILLDNKKIKANSSIFKSNPINTYLANLEINSDEFVKSRNIIKYYLEILIDKYSYPIAVCKIINLSYALKNFGMVKFLLSLKNSRIGISTLLATSESYSQLCLINNSLNNIVLDYHRNFTMKIPELKNYLLYDFVIENIPDNAGIDIHILTAIINANEISEILYNQYIYLIRDYVKHFDSIDNCNDLTHKYYCNKATLEYMYKILLYPYYGFVEFKNKLKNELTDDFTIEELREGIKKIYYKIRKNKKQSKKLTDLVNQARNSNLSSLERHRSMDITFEYILKNTDYLLNNKIFRDMIVKKIHEFLTDKSVDEKYIETAHLMDTVRKLKSIIISMDKLGLFNEE